MKKLPYGISNFETLKSENYYYVDKTRFIEEMENTGGRYLFFLRPRRFGKSLFISMLEYYYDRNRKDEFQTLFGDTYIGKNPTKLQGTYPVLKFNFSGIRTDGDLEVTKRSFDMKIKNSIRSFYFANTDVTGGKEQFAEDMEDINDATDLLSAFIDLMKDRQVDYYLLIDEYDNFANNILIEHGKNRYQSITHAGGFLRSFFAVIKNGTDSRTIDRLFVTGVSPLVLADVTSGFNMGRNISVETEFATAVGFTQTEVETMVDYYVSEGLIKLPRKEVLTALKTWYDGYVFGEEAPHVYNSDMVLHYMDLYHMNGKPPLDMIDTNIRTDYGKLRFLIKESHGLNGNFNILRKVLEEKEIETELIRSFAIGETLDNDKFVSLLYYLGLLSIKELTSFGVTLRIPNMVIEKMMWEYIHKALTESEGLRFNYSEYHRLMVKMALKGDWRPVFEYIADRYYEVASNRDFIYKEAGVKGFFLAYLSIPNIYDTASEREVSGGYMDVVLNPNDLLHKQMLPDVWIIEFKYIKRSEVTEERLAEERRKSEVQLEKYASKPRGGRPVHKIYVAAASDRILAMEEIS